jgi:uncharacterized protein YndB with AHSA1/START domain
VARVEHEITVSRPIDEVFTYLADGDRLTEWMGDEFRENEKVSEGGVGKGTTYRYVTNRGGIESTWEWAEFDPPRRLSWHGERVTPMGPLGSVEPQGGYTLEQADGGTRVRGVLAPQMRGVMKLMEPMWTRSARKRWQSQLETMKRIVESGRAPAGGAN